MLRVRREKQHLCDRHWIEIVSPETSGCERSCVDSFRQTAAPLGGVHIQSGNVTVQRAGAQDLQFEKRQLIGSVAIVGYPPRLVSI